MSSVTFDLDDVAFEIRVQLDSAIAHIAAYQAPINHASGLTAAISAYAYADLMLHGLDVKYVHEVERFTELRREARKLIAQFWTVFKLVPLTFGNGHTVVAQPVEPPKHIIKHVGENRLGGKPSKRPSERFFFSPGQRDEVLEYLRNINADEQLRDQFKEIADLYKAPWNTIAHMYYTEVKHS